MLSIIKELISPFYCLHCNVGINSEALFCFQCSHLIEPPKITMFCTVCKTSDCKHEKNRLIEVTEYIGPGKKLTDLLVNNQKWAFDIILNLFLASLIIYNQASQNIFFIKDKLFLDQNEMLAYKLAKLTNTKAIKYKNQKAGLILIAKISKKTYIPNKTDLTIITCSNTQFV